MNKSSPACRSGPSLTNGCAGSSEIDPIATGSFRGLSRLCEIRIRGERRAGELLREMKERVTRQSATRPPKISVVERDASPTLDDLGITRDQSSNWQQLANVLTDAEIRG